MNLQEINCVLLGLLLLLGIWNQILLRREKQYLIILASNIKDFVHIYMSNHKKIMFELDEVKEQINESKTKRLHKSRDYSEYCE
jgi:hypothetical protein